MDNNSRKAQARYKDYDKYVQFKQRFAVGDYVFVTRLPLKTAATDRMFSERYFKLLLRRTRLYRFISAGPEDAKVDQEAILITVSFIRLIDVTKEEI